MYWYATNHLSFLALTHSSRAIISCQCCCYSLLSSAQHRQWVLIKQPERSIYNIIWAHSYTPTFILWIDQRFWHWDDREFYLCINIVSFTWIIIANVILFGSVLFSRCFSDFWFILLLIAVYIISIFPIFPGYDLRVNKLENLLPSWLIDNEYYTLSHPDTDTKPMQ